MSGMSFLERLLDGAAVEWKSFGDVAKVQRGASPRPISKFITDDENGIPWIKIGDTSPNSKYVESTEQKITPEGATKSRILKKGDFIMSNSMSFGRPYILNIDGAIHDGWASISCFGDRLNADYLYHYLSSDLVQNYWISKINSGSVSNLNSEIIKSLEIPIPPLKVQAEIVRILDTFTALTAELTTELNDRKKQYNYYRDRLLTFEEGEVEWKPLGEEFPFIRNGFVGTVTPFFTDAENGVRYLQGTNIHNGVISDNATYYITKDFHQKCSRTELKADDILMVQSGHVGESAVVGEKYKGSNCHALIVMSNGGKCNSKFVNYYFQSTDGKNKLKRITTGGTVQHILASKMKQFIIPVPPPEEQARIVAILDKFATLTHSISEGLPREIALRQKQYEYYRDLLLSFPKMEEEQ